jgi:metallo-beta-lactamase class B
VNPGYQLVGNQLYTKIAEDYAKTFRVLNSLPCDLFLGAHGSYFDLERKYERFKSGGTTAFVDPTGCKDYVTDREQAFRSELQKQQAKSN